MSNWKTLRVLVELPMQIPEGAKKFSAADLASSIDAHMVAIEGSLRNDPAITVGRAKVKEYNRVLGKRKG